MEFPDLGDHCSLPSCRRLDFLPIKCSSCKQIFCSNHFLYEAHNCDCKEDNQVPVCPLCNKPVPIKPGESPDFKVSEHIDQNCQTRREKVFKNRCAFATCKKKELMPLKCESCGENHCLQHRHPTDHKCAGPKVASKRPGSGSGRTNTQFLDALARRSANAFESVRANVASTLHTARSSIPQAAAGSRGPSGGQPISTRQLPSVSNLQGNLTEEEALNIAIQESLVLANQAESTTNSPASAQSSQQSNTNSPKCRVS